MPSVKGHDSSYWAGNTTDPASTGAPGQQKPGWQNHKPNSDRMSEDSKLSGLAAGVRATNAKARASSAFRSQGAGAQPYGQQPYDPRYAPQAPMSFTTGVFSQLVGQWRHNTWLSLGRIPFLGRRADQFLATLQHAAVNFETSVFRKLGGGFAPQHYPQPPHWGGMQQPVHPQAHYGQGMPPPYRQPGAPVQPLAKEVVSEPEKEQAKEQSKPADASSRKEFLHDGQANIGEQQRAGEAVSPQDVNAANKAAVDAAIAASYKTGLEAAMGKVADIKSPSDAVATSIRVFDEFRARAKDILFQPLSDLPAGDGVTGRKMMAPLSAAFQDCMKAIGNKALELRFSPEEATILNAANRHLAEYKRSVAGWLDARLADRDPETHAELTAAIEKEMADKDAPVDAFKEVFAKAQKSGSNRNPAV